MNAILLLLSLLISVTAGMAQDISTGPGLARSTSRSQYMLGIQTDSAAAPNRIRIVGIAESTSGQIEASVIVLDAEGNLLPISPETMSVMADISCRGSAPTAYSLSLTSTPRTDVPPAGVSLYVLCDNSMLAGTLARDAVLSMQRGLAYASESDAIGFGVYNQALNPVLPIGPLNNLNEALRLEDIPPADGLSSLYTSAQGACRLLSKSSGQRALVVVTSTADNATPFSTTKDVARFARESNIPIFVVRVGLEATGRPLRIITSATGGGLYSLNEDETSAIGDVIREILFSLKWSSKLVVRANIQDYVNCESPWLRLRIESADNPAGISDSILATPADVAIETSPSIVALFRDTTDTDLRDYYQSLLTISEILSANPDMTIELSGHVSSDIGKSGDARALERAKQVRAFLIANGVLARQITVRSEGSRKPRYYFQDDGTRRLLNNRVEARMFVNDSAQLAIIVEQVDNEQTAMIRIKEWKDRKFNAFFEPIYENGETRYRVKLWGFSTPDEAKAVVAQIKKFKPSYSIIE